MREIGGKLRRLAARVRKGDFTYLYQRLRKPIWSEQRQIIMRRDLLASSPAPRVLAEFALRPLETGDEEVLFANMPPDHRPEKEKREYWLRQGLKGCHVAVLKDGTPCFVQWLLSSAENEKLHSIFEGSLPAVAADTVLLEGAYTPPRFRRLSIMPAAMARLAEKGRDLGARWAVVSVAPDNGSMQRAAEWAGFEVYQLRIDRLRLFRRFVTFIDLSAAREARQA